MAACSRRAYLGLTLFTGVVLSCAASIPARAQYTFQYSFGSTGTGDGQFTNPADVKFDLSGNIFVADSGNNRVQEFNSAGVYVRQFGSSGNTNGNFTNPLGLAIDGNNNIFVADTNYDRVEKFNNSGVYQAQFGRFGSANQFSNLSFPTGLAFDSSGNIYISDNGTDRILKYTVSGPNGNTFTLSSQVIGGSGSGNGRLSFPNGMVIDKNNNIFVADSSNHRIDKFTTSGTFLTSFTTTGPDGQTFRPFGVAVDSSGNVFATDFSTNFVVKFNSAGEVLDEFGTPGTGPGEFGQAEGITVDNAGNVYVSDFKNNTVDVFAQVAPVPEAGTLLTLACMTAGGLYTTRRLKKDRRSKPVTPASGK